MSGHDLSGIQYNAGQPHLEDRIAIVVSKWNSEVTLSLARAARETLIAAGLPPDNILEKQVPGTYELPLAAAWFLEHEQVDAVLCLGCVIQGETRHFDFICEAAAQGIMRLGLDYQKPVIFGVLTPDTLQQALDRSGGKYGNKGEEAAVAALEMIDLRRTFRH
jgi:6,7-dimethyl-8-ribityllumazine synthase